MATSIPAASRRQVEGRDAQRCVRCGIPTITGHWHHRRSRSVRDEHQHCACNGVYLCGACHKWVHEHPFEAREMGWIVSRAFLPFEQPVFNQSFGWLMLACDGSRTQIDDPRE